MKKTLIVLLLSAALLLAACSGGAGAPPAATTAPAQPAEPQAPAAANHLEAIKKAGVIKVGTSADYPPFEYIDSAGTKIGFDIALMEEIANRLGVKLEWVDLPFDSLIAGVQSGKIDAAISAFSSTPERDKLVDFTAPYFTAEDAFLVADGFTGKIEKPEDVTNYRVGVQTGTAQDNWLTENLVNPGKLPEASLIRYDNVQQAVDDLKSGKVDVLMADAVPAKALAEQGGMKLVFSGVLSSGPMNIVVPDGDAALAGEINKIVQQLQQEGFIDQLAVQFIGGQQ
jgi:polar amino acid transport system substrate-binding protein